MTLLEALVVLVLAGTMAAAIGTALIPDSAKRDVAASISAFRRIAAFAQGEALRTRSLRVVEIDLAARELRVVDPPRKERLPVSVGTKLVSAAELTQGTVSRIAFFPDGSATGATMTFQAGAHQERLRLNWITGRIDHATPGS